MLTFLVCFIFVIFFHAFIFKLLRGEKSRRRRDYTNYSSYDYSSSSNSSSDFGGGESGGGGSSNDW